MFELQTFGLVSRLDNESSNRPAVLDDDSIQRLSQLTNEHQVVAFLTPVFEQILQEVQGVQVVNSEECPWLETSSDGRFDQKPEHIFCHSALYNRRDPFITEDAELLRLRRPTDRYGVLADWALRDSIVAIGEGRVKIEEDAIGEVVNYARHVCFRPYSPPKYTKMLLYDKHEFWMVRVTSGEISSINICGWASAGSRQSLVGFFQQGKSPWVVLLEAACDHWNLDVQNDTFIGKGAFGRVFRATSREDGGRRIVKALKLVLPGDYAVGNLELFAEKESLVKAAKVLPKSVAGVDDFHDFGSIDAALVLVDIGSKVPKTQWRQLFETLGALHEHNFLHGAPRVPNAICVQGEVRWIDFRKSVFAIDTTTVATVPLKQWDIAILVKSCFDELRAAMGTDVEAMVQDYDGTAAMGPDVESMVQDYDGTAASAAVLHGELAKAHGL